MPFFYSLIFTTLTISLLSHAEAPKQKKKPLPEEERPHLVYCKVDKDKLKREYKVSLITNEYGTHYCLFFKNKETSKEKGVSAWVKIKMVDAKPVIKKDSFTLKFDSETGGVELDLKATKKESSLYLWADEGLEINGNDPEELDHRMGLGNTEGVLKLSCQFPKPKPKTPPKAD